MTKVLPIAGFRPLEESAVNPESIQRILRAAGLDPDLVDDNVLIVPARRFVIVITIAGSPSAKLFYSARRTFKPGVSMKRQLLTADRINRRNVGATYVDDGKLVTCATLSFAGGILPNTVTHTILDFISLLEDALESDASAELG